MTHYVTLATHHTVFEGQIPGGPAYYGPAKDAGVFYAIWRPEELGAKRAGDLVEPLSKGMEAMATMQATGPVGELAALVRSYLIACVQFPDATVRVGSVSPARAILANELAAELRGFVEWAEEHREQAKRAGERPAIDAHRITRAKALLKRASK